MLSICDGGIWNGYYRVTLRDNDKTISSGATAGAIGAPVGDSSYSATRQP